MNQIEDVIITPALIEAAEIQILEQTKRIDYYLTEYSIELLASKMENGEFEIPGYQREYTWEESRKWRFIESLLMNLPIPFLFFWENPKSGKLEIVDGVQRLSTIHEFLYQGLVLGDMEKLPALSGFSFSNLMESRQRKLKNRSIRGIVLNEHADDQARFDLFDRINTGSKAANKAEIRRGALQGPFMRLVIDLAQDPSFIETTPVTDKQLKEREREELVTRFFAYSDGLEDYDDEVSPFLYAYTRKMNNQFTNNPNLIEEYRERFRVMVEFVKQNTPFGFRRTAKGKASPRARFESISVGCYLALKENPTLVCNPDKNAVWLQSDEFSNITGADGANAIKRLSGRIEYVKNKLLGC